MARRNTGTARKAANKDYPAIAVSYAEDVISGKVISGRLLRLRCQTFLDELRRTDWSFRFDPERATKACKFIECLPVPDSQKDDEQVILRPWQVFIIANIFGWVDTETGFRRFTQAHIWVGAGNGKSFLGSAIGLYMAFGEGQRASEVVCAAYAKKQAEIVFDTAKQMMQFHPKFAEFLGVEVNAHCLVQSSTGSKFEPRSSEAKTLAGMRPYCAIIDELHVVNQEVYAFITNRLAKRDQSLLLTISTAGYDISSLGFTIFEESRKVIEGSLDAPAVFAVIYQAESENVLDENEWAKAHPNLDVTVRRGIVRTKAQEAANFSTLRYQFITEQLNRWVNARETWLSADRWNERADTSLRLEQFKGKPALIGLDLAPGRSDMTAKAYVFVTEYGPQRSYAVFFKLYLPQDTVDTKPERYGAWVQDGLLTVHPGATIDFGTIENELLQDLKDFSGSEVCYDPAFATQIAQDLEKLGFQPVETGQGTKELNLAMHEVEEVVKSGRLRHDGNAAASWQVANVTVKPNAGGMIRPDKSHPDNKIDAASALFTAMRRAMVAEPPAPARIRWM